MFLAILLIAALALNVSAAGFYDWKTIGGYEYYATVNCGYLDYSAYTDTMCRTSTVRVEATAYALNASGGYSALQTRFDECKMTAKVRGATYSNITYTLSWHYADGSLFYNPQVFAS